MWKKQPDSLVYLEGDTELLRFCLDPAEAKTFLHPVRAPGQETCLTDCYPGDHIWHRGVWFSWKTINGLNYWEEDKQHVSDGLTRVDDQQITVDDEKANIEMNLSYLPPDGEPVLSEHRKIISSAHGKGVLAVDYSFSFTAMQDAVLAATPVPGEPGGVWYGGYAGFSVRRSPETLAWDHQDSTGRKGEKNIQGQTARWVSAGGEVPEGSASLTILSHPENPRDPQKWYVFGKILPYFCPALLMGGALVLKKGQSFTCRYRLLVANSVLTAEQIEFEYSNYIN